MDLDRLQNTLRRIDGQGARKGQHGETLGAVVGLLDRLRGWIVMIHESGVGIEHLAPAERDLLAAALGCPAAELAARWSRMGS